MITHKTVTFDVSGATAFGITEITFGTAGIVSWSEGLSRPPLVEKAADAPAAQVSPARAGFDAICVRVPINEKFFDVAVPNGTFGKSRSDQEDIAVQVGGDIGTREQNRAVVNYLLDREAFDLLAKEKAGTITKAEKKSLVLHRKKWVYDKGAETRAKEAGAITDKEAALLEVYRDGGWVRDTAGGLDVVGVCVRDYNGSYYCDGNPDHGALVLRPSAESK